MKSGKLTSEIVGKVKDGLKGQLSDQSLDDQVKRFQASMEALEDQVNYLHVSSTVATSSTIADMAPKVSNIEATSMWTSGVTHAIDRRTNEMESHVETIETGVRGLQSGMTLQNSMTYKINKQLDASTQATRDLSALLQGVIQSAECQ